jgi:hypothetical protein
LSAVTNICEVPRWRSWPDTAQATRKWVRDTLRYLQEK